jgi:hypothetical protein
MMREYVDDVLYVPTGRRVGGMEYSRGSEWMRSMRDGHWERLHDITGLYEDQFEALHETLIDDGLTGSDIITSDEKLGIFLALVCNDMSYRMLRELFQHSLHTINRAFHQVLRLIRKKVYPRVVTPVENIVADEIRSSRSRWPFFEGCRGAIDGTHIPIAIGRRAVKEGQKKPVPAAWRSRKGYYSQNVFACVDFKANFRFVLAGWEGSAHDARVLRCAINQGFKAPAPETYFLADGGYSSIGGLLLIPYRKTRYHFSEWDRSGKNPENAKELFNKRHSSLRMVVERAFGILKWRFKVLQKARKGFGIRTQVFIVYACIALHNWLHSHGSNMEADAAEALNAGWINAEENAADVLGMPEELESDEFRDELAEIMWERYLEWKAGMGD